MKCILCKKNIVFLFAFFVIFASVGAQGEGDTSGIAPEGKNEFVLTGDSSWCLTDTEYTFTVILPQILPSQVRFENPAGIAGATLLSASKNLWVEGLNSGTNIEFVFRFTQSGRIEFPPLQVMIDGQAYAIPFAAVEVFPNPKSLKPQVLLSFQDELGHEISFQHEEALLENSRLGNAELLQAVAGKPLVVTVFLRYAASLAGLTWDLSPEALFQQLIGYEESWNHSSEELSHEFQPLAQFSYIPLKTGMLQFPRITLEVQGYDEQLHSLILGHFPVVAQPSQEPVVSSDSQTFPAQSALALAFSPPAQVEAESFPGVQSEMAQKLAALRWKEKMSFPWSSVYQQRQQLELDLGVTGSKREPSLLLGWFGVGLSFVVLVLTGFTIFRKKVFFSVILSFFCILVFVFSIVYLKPSFQSSGILAANNLSRIPEPVATHLFPVAPYSFVEIQEEVLGWYYVETAGLEGWIPKEMVIPIQKNSK